MSSVVALTELLTLNTDGSPVSSSNPLPVAPDNITGKFRETFETFVPGVNWNLVTGTGDIVQTDGNAVSASYLVISKDPLTADTETTLTYTGSFPMPIETAVGLSMSQRVLGQELAMEVVSTETPLPLPTDKAISSISQTTTTLTVTTTTAHGLSPGMRIGIVGVTSDSRLNYPSLVVATITSTTTFLCTAGPGGTIPSLTVGPYTNQGTVYYRSPMRGAQNGVSEIFENATATNASVYFRSAAGDVLPSGTFGGNQSLTIATTASTQGINSAYTYAFLPTSEYRINLQADRGIVYDAAIDTTAVSSSRQYRTQIIPDPTKQYTLRFRFTNNKGLTVPTAKIVSASKAGSTTATITTDVAHGLTTGDYVVIYGIRDQTNFANQTSPQVVASVINSTQFTVAFGASATATSYGGMVARGQGGNVPGAFPGLAVQSAFTAGLPNELQMVASANWSWVVGDYVNVYGVRDNTTGADLGVDGVYRVVDVATTTIRLAPINPSTVLPSFASTNCGGTAIKRTDARISFVRIFEYLRERVEVLAQPALAAATPIAALGGTISTVSTVSTAFLGANTITTDITSAAITTTANSSTITPSSGALSQEFNVIVTAVSGTNPTLDVVVQESDDSGTNWYDTYHFPRITATGQYRSPLIQLTGNRVRYVQTVGGSSPSFTRAINRVFGHTSVSVQKQFFDRTLAVNTLNATSPVFFVDGCVDFNLIVSMGAVTTTAPVLTLEFSVDNAQWYQPGADITTAANINQVVTQATMLARFVRVRVKTAGSGATLNYIAIKGVGQ